MVRNNLCDSEMHLNILANIEKTLVSLKKQGPSKERDTRKKINGIF